ncbi:MAG TPA: helix-turn-helix transcriptional regulator [Candidatus Elarobacter sp.]|nr:helix-turn-helix transcriptional regulator [Candidatus Elarobacter sp.]
MDEQDPPTGRKRLSSLLRTCRSRIDAEARMLGAVPRDSHRYGKRVTQDELAEAIGISRQWYAELERGREARVSPVVLGRLADTLEMSTVEREALFTLTIPALAHAGLSTYSADLMQIGSLRPLVRRLWSATTEAEALALILEDCSARFTGIDLAMCDRRIAEGRWEFPVMFGASEARTRLADLAASINADLSPAELDECHLHRVLTQPGESGIFNMLYPRLTVAPRLDRELRRCGLDEATFLVAYVRTAQDYEAMLTVYRNAHQPAFSEAEILMFGALAGIASLALGGAVGTE